MQIEKSCNNKVYSVVHNTNKKFNLMFSGAHNIVCTYIK